MKKIIVPFLLAVVATISCAPQKEGEHKKNDSTSVAKEIVPIDTVKKSIPKEVVTTVGTTRVSIKYHAPSVRGRTIWGGLVPYGEVWVTGAHKATVLEIDHSFQVGEKEISAGKYALFTIPGANKWTIIINRNWDQHLTDEYDQKDDVVRLDVLPHKTDGLQERFYYAVSDLGNSKGSITIRWEKISVSVPFEIK
jgi:hypothetical protein